MNMRSRLLKSVPPTGTAPPGAAPGSVAAAPPPKVAGASGLAAPPPPAVSAPKARRPAALAGMKEVHVWLRQQAAEVLATPVGDKTRAQYERNGARLDAARPPGEAIDLSAHEGKASTFYAYRAAVRWHAAQRGAEAVRNYNAAKKAGDEVAAADAWQRVLYAAADLVTYPKDAKPGLPSPQAVAMGLDDPKPEGRPARAKREGRAATATRETAKLKAANSIARKYPDWRARMWVRLVEVDSPWLDHAAVAALTGARPEELRTAQIKRSGDVLQVAIYGAKVDGTKGQPWRLFTLKNDGSPEYAHLWAKARNKERVVDLPTGVTDYPDAFSAALARAGKQALPNADRMSGYVYRHAMASDLKADGFSREHIAAALGHAVTKTQDAYGRAIGGSAGKRALAVQCAREIRETHDTRYTTPQPAPALAVQPTQAFATPAFGDFTP